MKAAGAGNKFLAYSSFCIRLGCHIVTLFVVQDFTIVYQTGDANPENEFGKFRNFIF